jgi:hypothetical protein
MAKWTGDSAVFPFDSYREVLSEHARSHHLVISAWVVVAIVFALLVVFG